MTAPKIHEGQRQFSDRLKTALEREGVEPSPSNLARRFNARAGHHSVSAHGARKWLQGLAMPSGVRLEILARWLRVTPEWLRYNQGAMDDLGNVGEQASESDRRLIQDVSELCEDGYRIVHELVSFLSRDPMPDCPA